MAGLPAGSFVGRRIADAASAPPPDEAAEVDAEAARRRSWSHPSVGLAVLKNQLGYFAELLVKVVAAPRPWLIAVAVYSALNWRPSTLRAQ
jgi:hypothetical protein